MNLDGGRLVFGGKRASAGLGLAIVMALSALVSLAVGSQFGGGGNAYMVKVHFPAVNGIIEGSDVFFGGVRTGTVQRLDIDPDAKGVVVTMNIDRQYAPLHEDATAAIRPKSLLGEKYIAVTVGSPDKPAVADGATLPASATSVNVELDQLINIFDAPTRKQLQVLIDNLGVGLAGQGRMTNETIQTGGKDLNALADVTDVLAARDAELRRIIDALTRLTQTLSTDQNRQTYIDLLKHSDQVLQTLKQEDAHVQQGIERMNQFFGALDTGLAGRQQDVQALFADLPETLKDLDQLTQGLAAQGHVAYPLTITAAPGTIAAPIVFGSQPANTAFTKDVYTRVQPSQGCFTVDYRKYDAQGFAADSGVPHDGTHINPSTGQPDPTDATVKTLPIPCTGFATAFTTLGLTACLGNPTTECVLNVLQQMCTNLNLSPCPFGSAAQLSAAQRQTRLLPQGAQLPVPTAPKLGTLQQQAQDDLFRYLLR